MSLEAEPEDEPEAGEISMPKPERVQPGAEMRMASQPRLEEVIREPPPKQADSSDSSGGSSGQREARKEGSPDSEADSPGRRRSRKRKKRSLSHSPNRAHTSSKHIKSRGRHTQKASSKKKRRRSPSASSEDDDGSIGKGRRNGLTDKRQDRSADSSEDESDGGKRQRQKDAKHKKGAQSSRREHGQRRSDYTYVLCSLSPPFSSGQ